MLQPSDFEAPTQHPFGMLNGMGLKNTHENEAFLASLLMICQKRGSWSSINTQHTHPALVTANLLEETGNFQYRLTRKAKGLLYAYYGKDEEHEAG